MITCSVCATVRPDNEEQCPRCGWYRHPSWTVQEQNIHFEKHCALWNSTEEIPPRPVDPPNYPMVQIKAQSFVMGSGNDELGRDPDEDEHTVTLTKDFLIGLTEVPQRLYALLAFDNPSSFLGPDRPVDSITWIEAVQFCNAFSEHHKLTPAYTFKGTSVLWDIEANGYRLPTESEWECAARVAASGRPLQTQAWNESNSQYETHVVGQHVGPAESLGISDMAGNVWEWCWDFYAPYPKGPVSDPVGPKTGSSRVARGGSWVDAQRIVRPANRGQAPQHHRSNGIGFRLAKNRTIPTD